MRGGEILLSKRDRPLKRVTEREIERERERGGGGREGRKDGRGLFCFVLCGGESVTDGGDIDMVW